MSLLLINNGQKELAGGEWLTSRWVSISWSITENRSPIAAGLKSTSGDIGVGHITVGVDLLEICMLGGLVSECGGEYCD